MSKPSSHAHTVSFTLSAVSAVLSFFVSGYLGMACGLAAVVAGLWRGPARVSAIVVGVISILFGAGAIGLGVLVRSLRG